LTNKLNYGTLILEEKSMKVKEIISRMNSSYPIQYQISYNDGEEYDEVIVETEFDKAVIDLFGEREICEEDSIWFANGILHLYVE